MAELNFEDLLVRNAQLILEMNNANNLVEKLQQDVLKCPTINAKDKQDILLQLVKIRDILGKEKC